MGNNVVKVLGKIHSVTFPKTQQFAPGWKVLYFNIIKVIEGKINDSIKTSPLITISGETPELNIKSEYYVTGEFFESKYGPQYKILLMNENCDFTSTTGQRKFLETILPPITVDKLFRRFDNPIDLLKRNDVDALCSINGIGERTAIKLISAYENNAINSVAYVELYEYGLSKKMIDKLIKQFKSADTLVSEVKKNPYILIQKAKGIGWAKADTMARNSGIGENDPRRISAYIDYFLYSEAEEHGNTWVYDRELFDAICQIMSNIDRDLIGSCVKNKIEIGELYHDTINKRICSPSYRNIEQEICNEIIRITNGESFSVAGINETISDCEKIVGFNYTEEQKQIITNILQKENVSIITGLAGSGKSSIMLPITKALTSAHKDVAQCCLSGKAALNLTEITGIPGMTIHKMLGFDPFTRRFQHNSSNKMSYDVIIVDELSMVGGKMLLSVLQSIKDGAKVIFIGDPGQLEPIGICNCLYDMSESGKISHYHLSKIMRQAEQSAIITESYKIYHREQILPNGFLGESTRGEKKDFKIISANDSMDCSAKVVREFKSLYYDSKIPVDDICIVVSKRSAGNCSARSINDNIHNIVCDKTGNHMTQKYSDGGIEYSVDYYVGDKIIITKNCYSTLTEFGEEAPVYNGNIGKIKWIADQNMCVSFLQGDIVLPKEMLLNVQLGYAITCHKCQGSGFPYVIAVCDPSAYTLNSKEMLYTQITRAKKMCILIGPPETIRNSTNKTNIKKKKTWLKEMLVEWKYSSTGLSKFDFEDLFDED